MLGANFDANSTVIMTSSNCATIKRLVSIMNSGDKTGFVARLKKTVFSHHGRIFSRQEHVSPADEVGPDNNGSEIDVTESTGLDGTQTCGELSSMPSTSPEGAKLGRATGNNTHVAIDILFGKQRWLLTAGKPTELACRDHIPVQTVRGDFHN